MFALGSENSRLPVATTTLRFPMFVKNLAIGLGCLVLFGGVFAASTTAILGAIDL